MSSGLCGGQSMTEFSTVCPSMSRLAGREDSDRVLDNWRQWILFPVLKNSSQHEKRCKVQIVLFSRIPVVVWLHSLVIIQWPGFFSSNHPLHSQSPRKGEQHMTGEEACLAHTILLLQSSLYYQLSATIQRWLSPDYTVKYLCSRWIIRGSWMENWASMGRCFRVRGCSVLALPEARTSVNKQARRRGEERDRNTHKNITGRSSGEGIPTMTVCPGVLLIQWQCVWDLSHVEHWSHCQSNAFQKVLLGGSNSNQCYFSTFIIQSFLTESPQTRTQPLQMAVDPHCYTSLLT